jgi:hypothetical protein
MYNSIASVELTTQMRRQFADAIERRVPESHPLRRRISTVLRALANRLDPAPAAS